MGGDSGSIWLEQMSHAAVGLHYGGETSTDPSDERSWAKRSIRVAETLNINLRRKAILVDTSTNGPAVATLGNVLLLGWVGTGNLQLNFMRSTNGLAFTNKVTLGDTSPHAPEVSSSAPARLRAVGVAAGLQPRHVGRNFLFVGVFHATGPNGPELDVTDVRALDGRSALSPKR